MRYVILNYDAGNVFNGVEVFGPFLDESYAVIWVNGHIRTDHGGPLSDFTWVMKATGGGDDTHCYEDDGEKECRVYTILEPVGPTP